MRIFRWATTLLALTLLVCACNGGDGTGATSAATTTTVAPATTTTTTVAPATTTTTTRPSGPTTTIPVDYDGPPPILWVTHPNEGLVSRLDAATGEVLDTIDVGGTPHEILYAEGAIWVVDSGRGVVLRIDPASLQVARLDAGPWPYRLTAIPGLIFVTNVTEEGSVTVLRATDGAKVGVLPVGEYPTATAVVAGPPPNRAQTSSDWWYLWVAHSHENLYWHLLNPQEAPFSGLSNYLGYPPEDTGPTTTTTTSPVDLDLVPRVFQAAEGVLETDEARRRLASEVAAIVPQMQDLAAQAASALEEARAAARRGDLEAARAAFTRLAEMQMPFLEAAHRSNDANERFIEANRQFYGWGSELRRNMALAYDTPQWSEVRNIADDVAQRADLGPWLNPPLSDPDEVPRQEQEDRRATFDAINTYAKAREEASALVGKLERGETIPEPPPAATGPQLSGWPTAGSGASLDPGTGLEDLVPWGTGLYGFSWNGGGLVGFDPYSGQLQQQWAGPDELSAGFTGGGSLWGVAPGDGLWAFDGLDFAQYLGMPGLAAADPWWNTIYAGTETGEIYSVPYQGGTANLLIGGLPPIFGITIQPPGGLTPSGPEACPGVPAWAASLAPPSIPGYGEACPDGTLAGALGLQDPLRAWDPLWNPVVWACGCE